jgi:hypothetical protein
MSDHTIKVKESSFLVIVGFVIIILGLISGWFLTTRMFIEALALQNGIISVGEISKCKK